jgi:ribonucleoside-diphosphate reductase alpha chain
MVSTKMKKIKNKIVGYALADGRKPLLLENSIPHPEVKEREAQLTGITYKIKPGEHAYYITINDIYDMETGDLRPYEIFINSKDTGSRQWIDALTRVISAVLRKGGEYKFLVEELTAIADPAGGRFHKGRYITSMVAEIGYVLDEHISNLSPEIGMEEPAKEREAPVLGARCNKCGALAVVPRDGCDTCLACGDSKCQ